MTLRPSRLSTPAISAIYPALKRLGLVLLAAALQAAPGLAQAPVPPPRASSDLAQQNLSHVAAAAARIREVLQSDAGMLVELKRWIALEASNRGQIVDDADLTDQAIFVRLEEDVEFRSVATRLLQRYGYLLPTLKPDSDLARERQAVIQERAKLIARSEIEEEGLQRRDSRSGEPDLASSPRAEPSSFDSSRLPAATRRPDQARSSGSPEALPDLNLPLPRIPDFPALTDPAAVSQQLVRTSSSPESGYLQTPRDMPSLSSTYDSRSRGQLSPLPDPSAPEETALSSNVGPLWKGSRSPTPAGRRGWRSPFSDSSRRPPAAEPAEMVRRPNPYADIPSLYDMYRQAPARTGELERYGADVFLRGTDSSDYLPMDLPVGPDYVVGPGDGLAIDLWGGYSQRLLRTVDREGRLALPEVGPVLVSGRSLSDVQRTLEQILRTQFRDVSADVSLSRLRTVRVYVVGDVAEPGAYDISSLSTPLNALFAAGGPTDRGSLRIVRHMRGDALLQEVDLYDLLLRGVRSDLERLQNGDTILVPPLRSQVTVEGAVRRPAVYELRSENSLAEVLELAGGILPTATLQHIQVERVEAHTRRTMLSLDLSTTASAAAVAAQLSAFPIQNGDEIRVLPIAPYSENAVYLEGHVLRPGRYSYRHGMRLTDLVSSYSDLMPEPAGSYAEVIRLNPPDFRPSVESFGLTAALANPAAAPFLHPLDTVRIFSRYDFENLPSVSVTGEVRRPGSYRTSGEVHLRDAIQLAGGLAPDALLETAQIYRHLPDSRLKITSINLGVALAGDPAENIVLQPRDHIVVHPNLAKVDPPSVIIKGEVAKPGRYPLTTNLRVADLIRLAGGLKRSAFIETADLTRFRNDGVTEQVATHEDVRIGAALAGDPAQDLPLRDGDTLAIRQIAGWNDIGASVKLRGEVQHPGIYGIRPGEKLSSLLERAGGFLPTAHPRAAIFQRIDVRELQEKSKEQLIRRIEQDTGNIRVSLDASPQEQAALQNAALQQRERVLATLRTTPVTGRLVIHLSGDLSALAGSPDDIDLRNGDLLFIPKRPDFVAVTGQVYNANAITFTPRKNAGWYLERAGGPTELAETKAIFIVRADGDVVSGSSGGWWSGGVLSTKIEPGDTIVVPEKAIGNATFWKNFLSIAQVASSAAITASVLAK